MGLALSSVLWLEDWPNVPVSQDSLWWLTDTLVKVKYSKLVQNYTYTTSSHRSCQKTLLKLSYHTNQSLIGLNLSCIAVIPKGLWQEIVHDPNSTFLPEDLLPSASLIHHQLLSFSPEYNNKQWPQPWVLQLRSLTIHLSVWSDTFTMFIYSTGRVADYIFQGLSIPYKLVMEGANKIAMHSCYYKTDQKHNILLVENYLFNLQYIVHSTQLGLNFSKSSSPHLDA